MIKCVGEPVQGRDRALLFGTKGGTLSFFLMKIRTFFPTPMETIHEQKMESPVMISTAHHKATMHSKNIPNTGKPMTPISPTDSRPSLSPTSPSLAKKSSQIMREWVKRSGSGSGSGSSSRPTKSVATLSIPGHQRMPIVHLGGGRLGESDIEPTIPTGLRPTVRKPSIQRENSADSRVTQWIDLYPEAIERMSSSKQPRQQGPGHYQHTRTMSDSSSSNTDENNNNNGRGRWKFTPDHHAAAAPDFDPRPAPLRIPSAKRRVAGDEDTAEKAPATAPLPGLTRSDSKWKPLPILPVQQHTQALAQAQALAQTTVTNKPTGNGMPARKPIQPPAPAETIQLPKRSATTEPNSRPKTPTSIAAEPVVPTTHKTTTAPTLPPLAIYVTPPPTPDCETGNGNGSRSSSPKVEQPAPKLISGPPALRINTGNSAFPAHDTPPTTSHGIISAGAATTSTTGAKTTTTTTTTTTTLVPVPDSDALRVSVASPTTLSDSLLSTDMDDAIKITIGMMCMPMMETDVISSSGSGKPQPPSDATASDTTKSVAVLSSRVVSPTMVRAASPPPPPLPASTFSPAPLAVAPPPAKQPSTTPSRHSPVPTKISSPTRGTKSPSSPSPKRSTASVATTGTRSTSRQGDRDREQTPEKEREITSPTSTSVKSPITLPNFSPTSESVPSPSRSNGFPGLNVGLAGGSTVGKVGTTSRYTKQERLWLHTHYRGEAPFLRAWGLDIKSPSDREEGVAILRDLMGMDTLSGQHFSPSTGKGEGEGI